MGSPSQRRRICRAMDQSARYNEKENKKQKQKEKKAIARKQVRRPGDILQLFGHHRSSCNLHMTTHTSDRALYARIFTVRPSLYIQRDIYTFCLFLYFFCPFFFLLPLMSFFSLALRSFSDVYLTWAQELYALSTP